jgi:hypothetical protein
MPDIPTNEPRQLRAGDTWEWRREDLAADYPAPTWTLTYRFKNAAGGFEIVASASGSFFAVTHAAGTTASIAAGTYDWAAQVANGSAKYTIDSGTLEVLANLFSGTATAANDQRSHNRKALDAIKAVMEGRASVDQQEYTIAGRSLKRTPMADLIMLLNFYEARVNGEIAEENLRNGRAVGNVIRVRL